TSVSNPSRLFKLLAPPLRHLYDGVRGSVSHLLYFSKFHLRFLGYLLRALDLDPVWLFGLGRSLEFVCMAL
ncbi:unnamed protein product, partial [Brassica napus]